MQGPSGLSVDALGNTNLTGKNIDNLGVLDGGSGLQVLGANIKGGGQYKGDAITLATFGNANNPVYGNDFLANGLQLFGSTDNKVVPHGQRLRPRAAGAEPDDQWPRQGLDAVGVARGIHITAEQQHLGTGSNAPAWGAGTGIRRRQHDRAGAVAPVGQGPDERLRVPRRHRVQVAQTIST